MNMTTGTIVGIIIAMGVGKVVVGTVGVFDSTKTRCCLAGTIIFGGFCLLFHKKLLLVKEAHGTSLIDAFGTGHTRIVNINQITTQQT